MGPVLGLIFRENRSTRELMSLPVTSNGSVLPDLGPISDLKSIICINKVRFKGKRSGLGTVFVLESVEIWKLMNYGNLLHI